MTRPSSETKAWVLIADDAQPIRTFLKALLRKAGYDPVGAADGAAALKMARQRSPDAVLLDIHMPGLSGLQVLEDLHSVDPHLPVIMVTGDDDIGTAVKAMRLGAYDYLTKPFGNAKVLASVKRAVERHQLGEQARSPRERLGRVPPVTEFLGVSTVITELHDQVVLAAATTRQVLITGETGSGKEFIARSIHARSSRRSGPFVAVNCDALAPSLARLELFGHEGIGELERVGRPGQLEMASDGALFLSNIGSLPLSTQDELLAFLQSSCAQRVGAAEPIPLDVRVIASSTVELRELVAGHLFRRDLYLRLADTILVVPPLRERPDDISYLVNSLIDATNQELGKHVAGLTSEATDLLLAHSWPGNVRELRHTIRRAMLLARDHIEPRHLAIEPPTFSA